MLIVIQYCERLSCQNNHSARSITRQVGDIKVFDKAERLIFSPHGDVFRGAERLSTSVYSPASLKLQEERGNKAFTPLVNDAERTLPEGNYPQPLSFLTSYRPCGEATLPRFWRLDAMGMLSRAYEVASLRKLSQGRPVGKTPVPC